MCKNLIKNGALTSPLIVYNRTNARATAFSEKFEHVKAVSSVAEAIQPADIIFSCLGDDAAVEEFTKTALQSNDVKGKLFVDCSTIHPDTTRRVSEILELHGASFVACPVFGTPVMADAGQLVTILSGSKENIDRMKKYTIGVISRANIDLGDANVGGASMFKLLGNSFILSFVETIGEGMVLCEKLGLDQDQLKHWINLMFPGPLSMFAERMKSGDYYQREYPLMAVDLARKDAQHIINLANSVAVPVKSVEIADYYLGRVREYMGPNGDMASIYGAVRQASGLKFENQ
ncbi:6-phosphogluconate dehydrogenase family protein [Talaromyces proteolyticus]|uniref:6-phosphogluconate dehydrogenase family protein n=1 Tax=Talaromyces proteolyticus TaxID=1131652 RepID=A0AAD4PZG1_9EURO|nr:6-phosphogluconate dehydrogenase family protein [Talaromyces proteolyticus]KAH8695654.1 6-phosphogluconate dehydrogenase family protein [Talaromyces proteolyticus]